MGWHSLPVFIRLAGRPVILLGTGEAADAKRRLLDRAGAVVVADAPDARLAIVAIEDESAALAAVEALRLRGVLVNAVDRPALCDFTLPAIVDRDPVLVAIGTGGVSAGLAAAVRQRLEGLLPARLGELASALFAGRARLRARFPDAGERRRALASAMAAGGPLDPLTAGAEQVAHWLAGDTQAGGNGRADLLLNDPDPERMMLWQAKALALADRVFHHPSVPPAILARARADAARLPVAEPPSPDREFTGFSVYVALLSEAGDGEGLA